MNLEFEAVKKNYDDIHRIWNKFYDWALLTFGSDIKDTTNTYDLYSRFVGYEVIEKVEIFVRDECPEIKIIWCDDEIFSSSIILLIPHPKMGISMIFIPQNTMTQNVMFFYENHMEQMINAINELKYVYNIK